MSLRVDEVASGKNAVEHPDPPMIGRQLVNQAQSAGIGALLQRLQVMRAALRDRKPSAMHQMDSSRACRRIDRQRAEA